MTIVISGLKTIKPIGSSNQKGLNISMDTSQSGNGSNDQEVVEELSRRKIQQWFIEDPSGPDLFTMNKDYIAVTNEKAGEIAIWSRHEVRREPHLVLNSHECPITSLTFNRNNRMKSQLMSGSSDRVILWNIDALFNQTESQGLLLGENLGKTISNIVFGPKGMMVAICIDTITLVFDLKTNETIMQLEGHKQLVVTAHFFTHSPHLITLSEDRTFMICDLVEKSIIYKSSIHPYSLISISESLHFSGRFSIGDEDGTIRVFEFQFNKVTRLNCLHEISLKKLLKRYHRQSTNKKDEPIPTFKVVSSEPVWKQQHDFISKQFAPKSPNSSFNSETEEIEYNLILHMQYINVLDTHSVLLVGTSPATYLINMHNYEILHLHEARGFAKFIQWENTNDGLVYEFISGADDEGGMILCDKVLRLDHMVNIEKVGEEEDSLSDSSTSDTGTTTSTTPNGTLSMMATEPLPKKLRSELIVVQKKSKKSKIKDKPVTFRSSVKSSGYGSKQPWGMKRKIGGAKRKVTKSKSAPKTVSTYNIKRGPPKENRGKYSIHRGSIMRMALSGDGSKLASVASSMALSINRLPLSKDTASMYMGHTSSVTDVHWSHSQRYVITSSHDASAIVWDVKSSKQEPLMVMHRSLDNFPVKTSSTKQAAPTFKGDIKNAQFYAMDRFIVLGRSNAISLYKYFIHPENKNDDILGKHTNKHRYKQCQLYTTDSQTVTSLATANSYLSHYIVFGGSNKTLNILDVSSNKVIRQYDDAHGRPINHIRLVESVASNQTMCMAPQQYFLTTAPDHTVNLWDCRTASCVRSFRGGHKNSIHSISASLSPCMRYVAMGSEDRCYYLYDFGSGSVIDRIHAHTDVVNDVLFHPRQNILLTSSYDGNVSSWTPSK